MGCSTGLATTPFIEKCCCSKSHETPQSNRYAIPVDDMLTKTLNLLEVWLDLDETGNLYRSAYHRCFGEVIQTLGGRSIDACMSEISVQICGDRQ